MHNSCTNTVCTQYSHVVARWHRLLSALSPGDIEQLLTFVRLSWGPEHALGIEAARTLPPTNLKRFWFKKLQPATLINIVQLGDSSELVTIKIRKLVLSYLGLRIDELTTCRRDHLNDAVWQYANCLHFSPFQLVPYCHIAVPWLLRCRWHAMARQEAWAGQERNLAPHACPKAWVSEHCTTISNARAAHAKSCTRSKSRAKTIGRTKLGNFGGLFTTLHIQRSHALGSTYNLLTSTVRPKLSLRSWHTVDASDSANLLEPIPSRKLQILLRLQSAKTYWNMLRPRLFIEFKGGLRRRRSRLYWPRGVLTTCHWNVRKVLKPWNVTRPQVYAGQSRCFQGALQVSSQLLLQGKHFKTKSSLTDS